MVWMMIGSFFMCLLKAKFHWFIKDHQIQHLLVSYFLTLMKPKKYVLLKPYNAMCLKTGCTLGLSS